MACPEMKNISITQKNPDGTSIPLTFKGCIVSRNNGTSTSKLKSIDKQNVSKKITLTDIKSKIDNMKDKLDNTKPANINIGVSIKNNDEYKITPPRDYQYDAYVKFKADIDKNNTKYYRYFKYPDNNNGFYDFWLRATHVQDVYLFIREDDTFYLIGPDNVLKEKSEELYKKYKYSFDRTEKGAQFNINSDAYIVIYYDENDNWYKLRLATKDEENTIITNINNPEWKEQHKWQGNTTDVYYLDTKGIVSGATLIGKEYKKMSGLCGYINRITMDSEPFVNGKLLSKGGKYTRKRHMRKMKKSMKNIMV
jgi:hypothetical protein